LIEIARQLTVADQKPVKLWPGLLPQQLLRHNQHFGETLYPANAGSDGTIAPTSGNHCGVGNAPMLHSVALPCNLVRKPAPALAQALHVSKFDTPKVSTPIGNAAGRDLAQKEFDRHVQTDVACVCGTQPFVFVQSRFKFSLRLKVKAALGARVSSSCPSKTVSLE
jgi:hypothetical protein